MNTERVKNLTRLAVTLACVMCVGQAVAAPILIANNSVAESALSAGDVQKIFLGKTANWGDGSRVMLSMLKDGPVSDEFLKTWVKKSQKQFGTFWKKAVFSGTGEMPAAFDSEAELVKFVAGTPGAVGYVDEATPHADVKVITID